MRDDHRMPTNRHDGEAPTMGWFLRSKAKPKKSKAKQHWQRSARKREPWDPQRTLLIMQRSATVIIILALAGGVLFGQRYLVRQVGREAATIVDVELVEAPAWLGPSRIEPLRQTIAATVSPNPLDHASLTAAAEALGRSPWVEHVQRIERRPEGHVRAFVTYREPVALVGARDGYHLVDASGRRLPGVYPLQQLSDLNLPVMTGVRAAPPAEGHRWAGSDLQGGLALTQMLAGQAYVDQVRAIDVSNYDGRIDPHQPQLILLTDEGVVRWGRAPGEEGVYEPAASQKLQALQRVARRYNGRIDAAGQVVDIFCDDPLIQPADHMLYTGVR
jgi:hypothetical protein